jgi:hypothetical protein
MPPETRPKTRKRYRWLWVTLGVLGLVIGGLALVSELQTDALVYRYLKDIDSPDPRVRANAVYNLYRPNAWVLRGRGERAIMRALDDPDTRVRDAAAHQVVRMEERARPAVPRLFELLNDPDPSTRVAVVRALIGLGPHPPSRPDAEIEQLLASPDPSIRRKGLVEVIRLGPDCKRLFLRVAELADDLDPAVRGLCFDILLTQDRRDPTDEAAARVVIEKYRAMPRDDPRWQEFADRVLDPKPRPVFDP